MKNIITALLFLLIITACSQEYLVKRDEKEVLKLICNPVPVEPLDKWVYTGTDYVSYRISINGSTHEVTKDTYYNIEEACEKFNRTRKN